MQKQEALGDAYNELRNALNSNPDHTVADNIGSGLPAEPGDNPPTPAPIMTESYPTIDDIKKQLAEDLVMTFHDSADDEKKHKRPAGQAYMVIQGIFTDPKDPVPTKAEIQANGEKITCRHSPFRHNFGADKAGMRYSFVTWWVNTRNQAGLVSDVRSVILG